MSPRTPASRRTASTAQPKPASSAARVGSRPELSGAPKAAAKLGKLKKDEFSTGRARALRAKTLGTTPAPVGAEAEPVTPPVTPVAGSPLDLVGLQPGSTDGPRVKQLQDTLMALGHLEDIRANGGYGKNFGPKTQAALKAFQQAQQVPQTGVVDRATVVALARVTGTDLGFDPASPFAPAFGLARNANAQGDRPGLKALQDALIAGGYAPASMTSQTGYGTHFGPITEAGLKAFQLDNGLPDTGVVDAATIAALEHPRARPAGFAAGLASTHRAQLGLPKGPAYTAPDGSLRQDFDRGSVWVTSDRVLHAEVQTPAGPQALVPPRKLGTAQSLEEARASFVSQWGPTAYNDPPAGSDVPYGYNDCGPTSALMALSALGLASRPSAADAHTAIDHQRDLIFGYDTTTSARLGLLPATKGTVGYGLEAAGAKVSGLRNTVADVDAALARGNPIILGSSSTWAAWGQAERAAGNYLNGRDPGGHFVTVLGRAANGNYLVGDPLLKGGPIEVTQAQLEAALKGAWSSANSLAEVSRP